MKLSRVLRKSLEMIQQYCEEKGCKNCRLKKNQYTNCLLGYPCNWRLDTVDLSQAVYGDCDYDRYDLYDFFEQEDEDDED